MWRQERDHGTETARIHLAMVVTIIWLAHAVSLMAAFA
jgi:hypothetical protein